MKTVFVTCTVFLASCGGAISTGARGADDAGTTPDSSQPAADASGTGPIDASGQPAALAMNCPAAMGLVALALPCHLGEPLSGASGGASVLVCATYASDAPSGCRSAEGTGAISFLVSLLRLAAQLNQPLALPSDEFSALPQPGSCELPGYPGETFTASLSGTVVVSQVDPEGRAFVGQLAQATVAWTGDRGDAFSCDVADGPFWAVAGNFQ
jgi:hypothetical protein